MSNMQAPRWPHPAHNPLLVHLSPSPQSELLLVFVSSAPSMVNRPSGLQTKVAGNNHSLDLAGTLVNGDHAGIAINPLHIGFTRIAEAAMNLNRLGGHTVHHLAGIQLGFRRRRSHPAAGIFQPSGVVDEPASSFDL